MTGQFLSSHHLDTNRKIYQWHHCFFTYFTIISFFFQCLLFSYGQSIFVCLSGCLFIVINLRSDRYYFTFKASNYNDITPTLG